MKYGYARVSTTDQDCSIQIRELISSGIDPTCIRSERKSGKSLEGRDELNTLLEFMREGDELVVSRLDRLARSIYDLSGIMKTFKERSISLRSIHEGLDISTAYGRAMVQFMGVFGELDYNMRRERQMAGIAKAKEEGKYEASRRRSLSGGRKAILSATDYVRIKAVFDERGGQETARRFKVGPATLYRYLKRMENEVWTSDKPA